MHFHVLGVGPIGVLVSHHLRMALNPKHSVVLIHKDLAQKRRAQKLGNVLTVERGGAEHTVSGFHSEVFELRQQLAEEEKRQSEPRNTENDESRDPDASAPSTERIESLFVTVKAPSVLNALRQLQPRLRRDSTIVLLNNGMGVYERVIRDIFRNPEHRPHFILASNDHGAILRSYMHAIHTGLGKITFGIVPDPLGRDFETSFSTPDYEGSLEDIMPPDDESEHYSSLRNTVAALSAMDGLETSWKPISHVLTLMKRKLVVNSVINPLTALMGCRNGDIFPTQATLRIASRVCWEASRVFEAEHRGGQSPDASWQALRVGPGISDFPAALQRHALEQEIQRVASNTAGNISSMLGDVQKGRTTEIDFMNGYLLQMGVAYKVQMPATATILNLIKMRTDIPINTNLLGIRPMGSKQRPERYVPVTKKVLDKALGRRRSSVR